MNMRLERRLGPIALLAMVMTTALGLVGCPGSPDVPEFPLGEEPDEPDMQPGGLAGAGSGSQAGGQENGFSSTTAGAQSATGSQSGEQPEQPAMTPEEQALAQIMSQIGGASGAAPGSQPGLSSSGPTGAGPTAMTGSTGQQSGAAASAGGDCCACTITSRQTINDPRLPCQFDIPGDWQVGVSRDSGMGMLSAMAGRQSCDTICPSGTPSMSISYGTQADANAATMQGIWKMGMREIGTAQCGAGEVTFYTPPGGTDEQEKLGGVKFYVNLDGQGYGGMAMFSCGEPGGWIPYRDLFIESFTDNPESTFPK